MLSYFLLPLALIVGFFMLYALIHLFTTDDMMETTAILVFVIVLGWCFSLMLTHLVPWFRHL